jgi:hypothetical protein
VNFAIVMDLIDQMPGTAGHTSEGIGMTAEEFGGAMHHDIRP